MLCLYEGCSRHSVYGMRGGRAIYCSTHMQAGMINLRSDKCTYYGCSKIPSFGGLMGEPLFCADHRQEWMIDVRGNKCVLDGCTKIAMFGYKGRAITHCFTHKLAHMISRKVKVCTYPGCKKYPIYRVIGECASRCSIHKTPDMVILSHIRPQSDIITSDIQHTEQNLCRVCKFYSPILSEKRICDHCIRNASSRIKTLNRGIMKKIFDNNAHILPPLINYTLEIHGPAPDFIFACSDKYIIIICDENQHIDYPLELARMNKIAESLEPNASLFIRFNPGVYLKPDGAIGDETLYNKCMNLVYFLSSIGIRRLPYNRTLSLVYYDRFNGINYVELPKY